MPVDAVALGALGVLVVVRLGQVVEARDLEELGRGAERGCRQDLRAIEWSTVETRAQERRERQLSLSLHDVVDEWILAKERGAHRRRDRSAAEHDDALGVPLLDSPGHEEAGEELFEG